MSASRIYAGIGKTNIELERLAKQAASMSSANNAETDRHGIVYVISREEIERSDHTRFFANFGPGTDKRRLREIEGGISFTICGYEGRPEELFEVPEVRQYFLQAHQYWPCWLFAADVRTSCFHMVVLSILQNLHIIREADSGLCRVQAPHHEIEAFFAQSLAPAALLDKRAGIGKRRGASRIQAMANYLGI